MTSLFPINTFPEVQRYKDAIRNHHIIGKQVDVLVGISSTLSRVTVWHILIKFMKSLLAKQKGPIFNQDAFVSVFNEMMAFFRSETLRILDIYPLENFEIFPQIDSPLDLGNSWSLGIIGLTLPSDWKSNESRLFKSRAPTYSDWNLRALVKEYDIPRFYRKKPDRSVDSKVFEELSTILSALRILKDGMIIQRSRTIRVNGWHVGGPTENIVKSDYVQNPKGLLYMFNEEDLDELRRIIGELQIANSDKGLPNALGRLQYSMERTDWKSDDKIIDSIIGLESLLLKDSKELSFRLGLKTAILLGENEKQRQEINSFMNESYRLRNMIMHGATKSKIKTVLKSMNVDSQAQAATKLEGILRNSVREYLGQRKSGLSRNQIIESLRYRILNDASTTIVHKIATDCSNEDFIARLQKLGGTPEVIVEILQKRELLKKNDE